MTTTCAPETSSRIRYGALVVLMIMGFLLVSAEFLPNGVLTDMATTLSVTPGQAGQMVTVTALAGLVVAPTIGLMFPRLDRRSLLMWLALAAAVAKVLVALSASLALVLGARFILGAAIGGYWAMSVAVAAALADPERLGRGVMFTAACVALATVAGVPLGVLLAELAGWQFVFVLASVLMLALAVAVRAVLPPVPAGPAVNPRTLVAVLRRPGVGLGLAGHAAIVLGHALALAYVRIALERIQGVDAATIITLLALFGVGGLAGNFAIGLVVDRAFKRLSVLSPVLLAAALVAIIALSNSVIGVGMAVALWGFLFSSWLIVVNTWVGRRMPDQLEAGGALVVIGFQFSIAFAGLVGGLLVDSIGIEAVYFLGAAMLALGAALFGVSNRR